MKKNKITTNIMFEDYGGVKCEFSFIGNQEIGIKKMEEFFEIAKSFSGKIMEMEILKTKIKSEKIIHQIRNKSVDKIIEVLLGYYIETTDGKKIYPFEELNKL